MLQYWIRISIAARNVRAARVSVKCVRARDVPAALKASPRDKTDRIPCSKQHNQTAERRARLPEIHGDLPRLSNRTISGIHSGHSPQDRKDQQTRSARLAGAAAELVERSSLLREQRCQTGDRARVLP